MLRVFIDLGLPFAVIVVLPPLVSTVQWISWNIPFLYRWMFRLVHPDIGLPRDLRKYLITSRQFGSFLIFFLAAGKIYSIGMMIGLPGGIYAREPTYGIWFLGYILLAYSVGYFLKPWIWRARYIRNAMTLPDLFKGYFDSRTLELTITSMIFLKTADAFLKLGLIP